MTSVYKSFIVTPHFVGFLLQPWLAAFKRYYIYCYKQPLVASWPVLIAGA